MLHLAPTVTYMSTMTQTRHPGHSKQSGRPAPRYASTGVVCVKTPVNVTL